jgi:hypothetical protein
LRQSAGLSRKCPSDRVIDRSYVCPSYRVME